MSNVKYILAHFEDPDEMMHGIDKLQENNISIYDVFTPMPIHGIEAKLGIKRSRLPIAAFLFGLTGTITAFSMIYYMLVYDWPMNIGGKPAFAMPNFIPIMVDQDHKPADHTYSWQTPSLGYDYLNKRI